MTFFFLFFAQPTIFPSFIPLKNFFPLKIFYPLKIFTPKNYFSPILKFFNLPLIFYCPPSLTPIFRSLQKVGDVNTQNTPGFGTPVYQHTQRQEDCTNNHELCLW